MESSTKQQTPEEMQHENDVLHRQLQSAQDALHLTQTRFHQHQVNTNRIVTTLKAELRRKENELKRQRTDQDKHIKTIISHLLFLEGQLRKDQKQIVHLLEEKETIVKQQKSEIKNLEEKNNKLVEALKEIYVRPGGNGMIHDKVSGEAGNHGYQKTLKDKEKDRAHKLKFNVMRERLRRHRSSFELHNPEPLDTLEEGTFRYGSQENLSDSCNKTDVKKDRRLSVPCRKPRPRSLVDLPQGINEYPLLEIGHELDLKKEYEDEVYDKIDDEPFENGTEEVANIPKSQSVPQESRSVTNGCCYDIKERPHSMSSADLLTLEKVTKSQLQGSNTPSNHSQGDSNPFKSIKTMLKRKGSKLRNKKRSVSLPQGTNQEYYEALKKHFDKYDLS